jgi:hypothetical protein
MDFIFTSPNQFLLYCRLGIVVFGTDCKKEECSNLFMLWNIEQNSRTFVCKWGNNITYYIMAKTLQILKIDIGLRSIIIWITDT